MTRVLIVDDDPIVNASYAKHFRDAGFEVRVALDPIDGFNVLHHFTPDAIVLDLKLPFRSGLDWLAGVRKNARFRDVPVLAVTAESPDSLLARSAHAAAVHSVLFKIDWDASAIVAATAFAATTRRG